MLTGTLDIFPGVPDGGARLTEEDACIPVALPKRIIRNWRKWNGKRVSVRARGIYRTEGSLEDERGIITAIRYEGRWLAVRMCPDGDVVAFAEKLYLRQ